MPGPVNVGLDWMRIPLAEWQGSRRANTYIREDAVTHKDSLGNEGRTDAGDLQVMSAGAGIRHAEYNLADARCGLRAILPAGPVTRCDGQHSGLARRWR